MWKNLKNKIDNNELSIIICLSDFKRISKIIKKIQYRSNNHYNQIEKKTQVFYRQILLNICKIIYYYYYYNLLKGM